MKCKNCDQTFIKNYNMEVGNYGKRVYICPNCGHEEVQREDTSKEKNK